MRSVRNGASARCRDSPCRAASHDGPRSLSASWRRLRAPPSPARPRASRLTSQLPPAHVRARLRADLSPRSHVDPPTRPTYSVPSSPVPGEQAGSCSIAVCKPHCGLAPGVAARQYRSLTYRAGLAWPLSHRRPTRVFVNATASAAARVCGSQVRLVCAVTVRDVAGWLLAAVDDSGCRSPTLSFDECKLTLCLCIQCRRSRLSDTAHRTSPRPSPHATRPRSFFADSYDLFVTDGVGNILKNLGAYPRATRGTLLVTAAAPAATSFPAVLPLRVQAPPTASARRTTT